MRIIRLSALVSWFQLSSSSLFSLSLFLGYPFLGESAGWCRKGSPSKQHCRPSERCSGIYPETSCKSFPLTESKLVSFIYMYWFRPTLSHEVTNLILTVELYKLVWLEKVIFWGSPGKLFFFVDIDGFLGRQIWKERKDLRLKSGPCGNWRSVVELQITHSAMLLAGLFGERAKALFLLRSPCGFQLAHADPSVNPSPTKPSVTAATSHNNHSCISCWLSGG